MVGDKSIAFDIAFDTPTGTAVTRAFPVAGNRGSLSALDANTGNAFTELAAKTSDAIVAFDMATGKMLCWYQGRGPISGGARTYRCFPVRNLCLIGFQAIASRLGFPLAERVVALEDRHCADKVIPLAA